MRVFGAEETKERLPYRRLAEEIRSVALDRAAEAPERIVVSLAGGGTMLVMPAADGEMAITKIVTVHPGNNALGLPTIRGEVVVMEAGTGNRLGLLDGSVVTDRRTAALSMLAAETMAPKPEGPLLIVGAGNQARAHLEAFRGGLGVSKVFIASRTKESAEALADYAESLGVEASVVNRPEEALGEAKLVVTATTSAEPVLPGEVESDVFIAAVGAFKPEMAELPAWLVKKSSIVVDTLEGAKSEAGDLIQAEKSVGFEWAEVLELREILEGERLSGGRAVVFESVGCAMWDLASARVAFG